MLASHLEPSSRPLAARALWALHLGLLIVFVRDMSPGATRTLDVVRRVADLLPTAIGLFGTPLFAPVRAQIEAILVDVASVASVAETDTRRP